MQDQAGSKNIQAKRSLLLVLDPLCERAAAELRRYNATNRRNRDTKRAAQGGGRPCQAARQFLHVHRLLLGAAVHFQGLLQAACDKGAAHRHHAGKERRHGSEWRAG